MDPVEVTVRVWLCERDCVWLRVAVGLGDWVWLGLWVTEALGAWLGEVDWLTLCDRVSDIEADCVWLADCDCVGDIDCEGVDD
jgi:hypothetical protein